MDEVSIFAFENYKAIMAHKLLSEGRRGQLSRAAEKLGCQPSFLSRVMNSEIQLTLDQAFGLCHFWNLNADEALYFRKLVEFDRAADPAYRAALEDDLEELKRANEDLAARTQKSDFPVAEQQAIYFSAWHWSALHFLTSIPEFQTVKALSRRLNFSEEQVTASLELLSNYGLVKKSRDRWIYHGGQFHLPRTSPFVLLHHQNWRARAVADAQTLNEGSVHYTSVLTLSRKDAVKLKQIVLDFISQSNELARPSDPEEALALTLDLFTI